ncbi:MAG: protein kinase [Gemmataceae bacterium]
MSDLKAQIWSAFSEATQLEGEEQEKFLNNLQQGNVEVYAAVCELLEQHDSTDLLGSNAPLGLLKKSQTASDEHHQESTYPQDDISAQNQSKPALENTLSWMQSNLPINSFDQINSLCQEFSAAWSRQSNNQTVDWQTGPPSLDSYLSQVSSEAMPQLLRNLLAIDIQNRQAFGEVPQLEDYAKRYPNYAELIRNVFLYQSLATPGESKQPKSSSKLSARHLGDYLLLDELGRGGMGVVFRARHELQGNEVALKTLPHVDGNALHLFKREFRALADTNHPNLIGLHTLEADGGHWFFTMDLLGGEDFLSYVRPAGDVNEARLRSSLAQLIAGVMALHGRNIVHRDLKPSNVMVLPNGHVVILDFGLVLGFEEGGASQNIGIVGTPRYMAPEQVGGQRITAASDWYAVGVMLYEALTGDAPFAGSLSEVLHGKQRLDPPSLPQDDRIPVDLADLCMDLLARDPERRPDALAIANTITTHQVPIEPGSGPSSQALVGREPQLATLQSAYASFTQDQSPIPLFIHGRSGEGKTTLAEQFLEPLRNSENLVILSGRCYDRESVPFKALDSLIDALSAFMQSLSVPEVECLLPDDSYFLRQVFPVMERVPAISTIPKTNLSGLDDQQIRHRAFSAFRELLYRLSRTRPLILFVDDLQWGDADSADVLFEVLRPPTAPKIFFIGTYRSDEAEKSPFLHEWQSLKQQHGLDLNQRDVSVAPLGLEECTQLMIGMLHQDSDLIRRRTLQFHAQTGGNPFLLTELIGCFDPETDSFEAMEMDEMLARKLGRLPPEAQPLLDILAVSGQTMSAEELAQATGLDGFPAATLTRMRNERIVRMIGNDSRQLIDTYHDRIRETVLDNLATSDRQDLHRDLAETIVRRVGGIPEDLSQAMERGEFPESDFTNPRIYDLSYHFNAAGERTRAWKYAVLGGKQAVRQYALDVAAKQFRIAANNAPNTPETIRCNILVNYGECLLFLGHFVEAKGKLEEATPLAKDPITLATIEGLQSELALRMGQVKTSMALRESSLRRLGHYIPKSTLGWVWGIAREWGVYFYNALFPKRTSERVLDEREERIGPLLIRLKLIYFFDNYFKAMWGVVNLLRFSNHHPDPAIQAVGNVSFAVGLNHLGLDATALKYLNRSKELSSGVDNLSLRALILCYQGAIQTYRGGHETAVTFLEQSLDLYRKTGTYWDSYSSLVHWFISNEKLGNNALVIDVARKTFFEGVHRGDDTSCHFGLAYWAVSACGNLPFSDLRSCFRALPEWDQATVLLLLGEAHWHTFHGRSKEALEVCEQAFQLIKTNHNYTSLGMAALPSLMTALRLRANDLVGNDNHQCQLLRRRAFRLAKWGSRFIRLWPIYQPHVLRELGYAYLSRGQLRKALQLSEQSCALTLTQKAKYEHAESLYLRGIVAKRSGLPEANQQIETAEASLAERARIIATEMNRSTYLSTSMET